MPASSVSVSFPASRYTEQRVEVLRVVQEEYKHDIAVYNIDNYNPGLPRYRSGTPVTISWSSGRENATFHGYVHHVAPAEGGMEVWCRGASSVLDNGLQVEYSRRTVPSVINEVARQINFDADVVPHGQVFDHVVTDGQRAWPVLAKYAQEIGYSFYAKNSRLLLHPRTQMTTRFAGQAPVLRAGSPGERGSLFDFTPRDGASQAGSHRHTNTLQGVDSRTGTPFSVRGGVAASVLGAKTYTPTGKAFHKDVVNTAAAARFRAIAMAENNRFHITATATADGSPRVHQTWPVLLAGVETPYVGLWFVKKVTHRIVPFEYLMELELGRDGLGTTVGVPDPRARRVVATRNNPQGRPKSSYPPTTMSAGRWRSQWSTASRTFRSGG